MPIEIKELHIKAIVGGKPNNTGDGRLKSEELSRLKKEIAKEVTEKILRILRQKNER